MINKNVISAIKPHSRIAQWVLDVRVNIFRRLESLVDLNSIVNALDVGVTSERDRPETNVFEMLYPHKNRVTGLSMQDASWIEQEYPGMKFVYGNGCDIQFPDSSFDLVHSHAVIEHVGTSENQQKLLSECVRVARKYVFLTTPNCWHPMETHTALPFLHWLPPSIYRGILKKTRFEYFSKEENLNLLTKKKIYDLCHKTEGVSNPQIFDEWFLGFKSNMILFIDKRASMEVCPPQFYTKKAV